MTLDAKKTRVTLIKRLKDAEDQNAWADFYQFYWEVITNWARINGCSHALAQDIFQETILCLLKNMPSFEYKPEKGNFRSYLKTIVLRRISDAYRKETKYVAKSGTSGSEAEGSQDDYFEDLADDSASAFAPALDKAWLQGVLSKALRNGYKKVDQTTYKSFCLYVLDGLPVEEVGSRLSIDRKGTIYQQKSRFLSILKKEFSDILDELGETNFSVDSIDSKDSLFTKALEELIVNKPDYRETMIKNCPPAKLLNQIEFVRAALSEFPPPEKEGASLLVIKHKRTPSETPCWINLDSETNIGRKEDSSIELDAEDVSGLHASILPCPKDKFLIRDENSANGVYLNSKKIDRESPLNNGDIIQVSSEYTMIFYKQ